MGKIYDAVVSGYLCVDMVVDFKQSEPFESIADILRPGKLVEIDGLNYTLGGVVANTGVALKLFGRRVQLNGLIGSDHIGEIALSLLDRYALSDGIGKTGDANTAFGLVIAPPGIDRIFLESPGCSSIFDISRIRFDAIAQSRVFHFGYPPLLKKFYDNNGEQLLRLFSRAKQLRTVTSLDFSLIDTHSESGKADWSYILQAILPSVDIFVPSLEEALQIAFPEKYDALQAEFPGKDIIDYIPVSLVRQIGRLFIAQGVKIVMIKAGHKGAYLLTGDIEPLNEIEGIALPADAWNFRELWCSASDLSSSRVHNTSGAGDTAAAAFLSALLDSEDPASCLQYAAIAGRNNLYSRNQYTDLGTWQQMTSELKKKTHGIKVSNEIALTVL